MGKKITFPIAVAKIGHVETINYFRNSDGLEYFLMSDNNRERG